MIPGSIYTGLLPIYPKDLPILLEAMEKDIPGTTHRPEVKDAVALLWLVTVGIGLGHMKMPESIHASIYSLVQELVLALPAGEVPDTLPHEIIKKVDE